MPWATLQLVTTDGFISWAIRRATFSEFSHVDYCFPDGRLLGAHIEDGVKIRPPDYEKFTKQQRYSVDLSQPQYEKLEAFLLAQVGKPYDKAAIVNMLVQRNWREHDKWFCSELIAAAFEHAGKPLLNPNVKVYRISPRDLTLSPYLR
jgi:uncharacterized protein YycO